MLPYSAVPARQGLYDPDAERDACGLAFVVDVQGRRSHRTVAQALTALRKDGVTSIVVTHRPSLIAHVDKILVLGAGRIQQFGPASQVLKAMQQQSQAKGDERAA